MSDSRLAGLDVQDFEEESASLARTEWEPRLNFMDVKCSDQVKCQSQRVHAYLDTIFSLMHVIYKASHWTGLSN
jgi:hypothetical protein